MTTSTHRCWAEISLQNLKHNFSLIQNHIPSDCGIIPVLKANAFGHGLVGCGLELEKLGAAMLSVANVEEAGELRKAKIKCPILLLSACLPDEWNEVLRLDLTPTLSSYSEAQQFNKIATKKKKKVTVHLKVDTGMGRLGAIYKDAESFIQKTLKLSHLEVDSIYTHFSSAGEDPVFTKKQGQLLEKLHLRFLHLKIHFSNSMGIVFHPEFSGDYVRPGFALYQSFPHTPLSRKIKPILTWKTRISLIKDFPAKHFISYSQSYKTKKSEKIAVLPVGYADGYPRALTNVGHVLVGGKKSPIRGRVTMDEFMVDISKVKNAKVGDEVVLVGSQGKETISIFDLAKLSGLLSYNIFTGIGPRVKRVFI
jgi:alanine racemase